MPDRNLPPPWSSEEHSAYFVVRDNNGLAVAYDVGHYGVFSGKRWENQIYPILKNVILSSD